ncbi:peptidylprolyl isomerase [Chryseobacterium nepalense]|uniref:Peptidylprolyl isomerase n=1 Tax=Chryseobacterium nepalense TaxID=1854498 RepID=A0ABY4K692_9FLAO|nr:peptidylprolyl isomerase [Chryseobacterium nepalense]UPQ76310.1 peptidylprolyl isomerase [Chryseobacterium nepalense]
MKKILFIGAFFAFHWAVSQQKSSIKIVESKKIELTSELSKDKVDLYNQAFMKFVAALKSSDKGKIKMLVSDKIAYYMSDDIISKLSGGISFERKMEVYKSGYQKLYENETYPIIQYKYADDQQDPPRDMINVIFENDGKILGVKSEYAE